MNISNLSKSELIEIKKTIRNYEKRKVSNNYPESEETALKYNYEFWKDQPVTNLKEIVSKLEVKKNKYELGELYNNFDTNISELFEFNCLDLSSDKDINELYNFLRKEYIRTYDGRFSFEYSKKYLKWYFNNMSNNSINVCLRVKSNNKLVGFIGGITVNMQIFQSEKNILLSKFLCLHSKIRNKNVTPKLLTLFMDKCKTLGAEVGLFSSKNIFWKPACKLETFHRPINYQRLNDFKYCYHDEESKLEDIIESYSLPDELTTNLFVKMNESHIEESFILFNEYKERYNIYPNFTKDEFSSLMLNDDMESYVITDDKNKVLDFISYLNVNLNVLNSSNNEKIKVAKLKYYTTENKSIIFMIKNILICAKKNGIDLFSVVNCMENNSLLRLFNFYEGRDKENYHFYNFNCINMESKQIGFTIL